MEQLESLKRTKEWESKQIAIGKLLFHRQVKETCFPCTIEESMIKITIEEICKVGNHATTETNQPLFVGIDHIVESNRCEMEIDINHEREGLFQERRIVSLHTLSHGSVEICVRDYLCACGQLIRYEGLFNGICCVS